MAFNDFLLESAGGGQRTSTAQPRCLRWTTGRRATVQRIDSLEGIVPLCGAASMFDYKINSHLNGGARELKYM